MFHWSSFVKYYAKNYIYIIESEGDAGVLKGWGFLSPKEMKSQQEIIMIKRDTKYLGFERGNMYMICMILDAEKIVKEVPQTKCKKKKKILSTMLPSSVPMLKL